MPDRLHDRSSSLAHAVADGEPIDWLALESGATSDEERSLLRRFKVIADIAELHTSGVIVDSRLSSLGGLGQLPDDDVPVYPAGATWGHLRILDVVGSGRYGVVYRAWDPKLEREVALKLLKRRDFSKKSEVIDEARMMARVHHQNVVAVYGADSRDGQVGIWMQFVKGRTLEAELASDGAFSPEQLGAVARELCDALSAVHRAGLVHRDVKPQNVLRDEQGRVLLGDFGTGGLVDEGHWGVAGTPLFLAPEVLEGASASVRSDIYALGVTLFHLATKSFPICGRSLTDVRRAHERGRTATHLAAIRPDLAGPIANVVDRALQPSPDDRWLTVEQLRAALATTRREEPSARTSRNKHRALFAGALIIAMLAVAATWREEHTPAPPATSARALRQYEAATSLMTGPPPWPNREIERMLRDALTSDPSFALARTALSNILYSDRRATGEFLDEAQRALADASDLPDIDRSLIEANLHRMEALATADPTKSRQHLQEALPLADRLLREQRGNQWTRFVPYQIYTALKDDAAVLRWHILLAAQFADGVVEQSWPGIELARAGKFSEAESYGQRATSLAAAKPDREYAFHTTWWALLPAQRAWMDDRPAAAATLLDSVSHSPPEGAKGTNTLHRQLVLMALTLGRLREAEQMSAAADSSVDVTANVDPIEGRNLRLAVSSHRDDRTEVRKLLEGYSTAERALPVLWLPIPNELFRKQLTLIASANPGSTTYDMNREFAQSRLSLLAGDLDQAIAGLQRLTERDLEERGVSRLIAVSMQLADAWMRKGQVARAIAVLEKSTRQRSATTYGASHGAMWLKARAMLAGVYRNAGAAEKAIAIERHVSGLMAVADADHPLKDLPQSAR